MKNSLMEALLDVNAHWPSPPYLAPKLDHSFVARIIGSKNTNKYRSRTETELRTCVTGSHNDRKGIGEGLVERIIYVEHTTPYCRPEVVCS